MRGCAVRHWGLVALVLAGPAVGQEGAAPAATAEPAGVVVPQSPILMLDRNRLLAETMFGKAVEQQFEADSRALIAENLRLEKALEAEERELTDRRATLPAEEFQALAAEFDRKTEAIRTAQDAKSRAITTKREEERQKFLQAAIPVLGDLMREAGAVAIFDSGLVILSLRGADITDEAIARIDKVLGDGRTGQAPPGDTTGTAPAKGDAGGTP